MCFFAELVVYFVNLFEVLIEELFLSSLEDLHHSVHLVIWKVFL